MLKLGKNVQPLVLLLIFLICLEGLYSGANVVLSTASYSTGYQGARAQYCGIYYKNEKYCNTTYGRFDTNLQFDPDDPTTGMCNLVGEMTSVFIPSESLSNMPDWIPTEWVRQTSYISNPKATYEWEAGNFTYTMEAWTLRWYFSISAEWDEAPFWETGTEYINRKYCNTEVWFEFDLTPKWYFEPVREDTAYFAIAKMEIADVELHALDNAGDEVEPELETSVRPDSQGSILPVYYGAFAEQNPADKEVNDYQGKQLNHDLFISKVYSYFTLENFGTHYSTDWSLGTHWKGDVVTVAVDVTVFVIGEWKVQDIESLEDYEGYGRTAQVGGGYSFADWLSSPANQFLLFLIFAVIVLVIIAVFAPSILMMLGKVISSFTGGRRR